MEDSIYAHESNNFEQPPIEQFKFEPSTSEKLDHAPPAVIKVIGVGGGGGNVLNYMANQNLTGVEFLALNTDMQDLNAIPEPVSKLTLGGSRRQGLGAGMNPLVGEAAAKESIAEIEDAIQDANLVFVVSCLGGGTGSGATPVVAQTAKDKDILTVAIVTLPLMEEQITRKRNAENSLKELYEIADSVVAIPNDKLCKIVDGSIPFAEAFNHMNNYLAEAVQGVADVINTLGLWNLDYKDVESVLSSNGDGITLIGKGDATGQNRAENAVHAALNCPLMEDTDLSGARSVLYNIRGHNLTFDECRQIMRVFNDIMTSSGGSGGIFPGIVEDPEMGDDLEITVLLTGINRQNPASVASGYAEQENEFDTHEESNVLSHSQFGFRTTRHHAEPERQVRNEGFRPNSISALQGSGSRRLDPSEIPALFRDQVD